MGLGSRVILRRTNQAQQITLQGKNTHMALQAGTQAPDFTLNSSLGEITLSDLRGKTVVIGFHPASFTGG